MANLCADVSKVVYGIERTVP